MKCIEVGCTEIAYNRGVRCIIHLDEHIREQERERKRLARERNRIQLICDGCGVSFTTDKRRYENKKSWGQDKFYHSGPCAQKANQAVYYGK